MDNPTREEIRAWLDKRSGKTPKWLGALCGVSGKTVSNWLSGQDIPDAAHTLIGLKMKEGDEKTQPAPPGYTEIFLNDEEINLADQASRIVDSPSLAAFCHDVILAEARRIIREKANRPTLSAVADAPNPDFQQMKGKVIYETKNQRGAKS